MVLWEVDTSRTPEDPKTKKAQLLGFQELVMKQLKEGGIKEWGAFAGELCGYFITEGNEVDLSYSILKGADLRGAILCSAKLRGANLIGASLEDADLRGADLIGALIDPKSIEGQKKGFSGGVSYLEKLALWRRKK